MHKIVEKCSNKINKFYNNINLQHNKVNHKLFNLFNHILFHSFKKMEDFIKWMDLNYVQLIMDHVIKMNF